MEDEECVLVQEPEEKDILSPTIIQSRSRRPLKVTFKEPAKHWTDALPIGNGRLGAMVWGGVASEVIQLNEDTLWTGTPGNYTDYSAPEALKQVRKLVDQGDYAEATAAAAKLTGNPYEAYQLLGDINLVFDDSHVTYVEESYHRELDLNNATVRVKYTVDDVEFTREHFASYPQQAIVTKISGNKPGSVSFVVSMDSKLQHYSYVHGKNQIIIEGSCPGKSIPPGVNANDNPKGIQFSAVLDLQISNSRGMMHILEDKRLRVEGSDWAVLVLVASSSYDGPLTKPSDSKRDPTSESLSLLGTIRKLSHSDIFAQHLEDYQNLFHRVSLQLSNNSTLGNGVWQAKKYVPSVTDLYFEGGEDDSVSTAERVKSFQNNEDPSLIELLFQYGRYLLISCSRPGSQVANLQGIWNKDLEPAWDGAPHLNINLEMNYWPSLPCNLSECQEPLFDFISSLSINGSKTAEVNYEASGWVVHHKSDIWARSSAGQGDVVWAIWPMGGAWLCVHLWEHYNYTMDQDFLENKAYPLLEGCVKFLLDWLIEGSGGYLETNPSTSPEHNFITSDGKPACVSYSSTMDMAIIKEVFFAIISAAEILGRNKDDLVEKVKKAQLRLPPTKIAKDGSIMEWAQEFEDPEVHHRHLSHLFGLYPGHTITLEKTPDLCKAAEASLYKRGEEGPGWSTSWKIALWARLQNSENSYNMIKRLINLVDPEQETDFKGGLYSNLFAAHPPFQIDANFGFIAALAEMFLQSTITDVYLLPALPAAKWANGYVKGLRARGGLTVDLFWEEGDLQEVSLWSKDHSCVRILHYREATVTEAVSSGVVYTFNGLLKCVKTLNILSEVALFPRA
ncbi:Alpha-L-fucosidase [Trema orientale]|uniref:Alpha-L-fucosidase n=1 Tax=Trema orientale TaxID=63057 RepID=A0A2P5EYM1_TREOI|nr:Alpha-L-fucosidase [Trema orientale]